MCIFRHLTIHYCKKILEAYERQADEKSYIGKEAKLLNRRNKLAQKLIERIKAIEVHEYDYTNYFQQNINEINLAIKEVNHCVREYNNQRKTTFTSDLYEQFFTSSLVNLINILHDLFKKTPFIINTLSDPSLFKNDHNVPWIFQFSFVLYEYILDREVEIIINKSIRDIFDIKKQFILRSVNKAAHFHSHIENENETEYKDFMKDLLKNMSSEEQNIQRRNPEENNASMYVYFTQSFYKTSERLIGKNQLGKKITFLTEAFEERTKSKELLHH